MLQYLIKTINNSLATVLMIALLFAVSLRFSDDSASAEPESGEKKRVLWALAAGFAAALIYAVLKRTTGFAVREYYDLGVLTLSISASVFLLFSLLRLAWSPFKRGAVFQFSAFFALAAWTAWVFPNLLLYPFEFGVGMETIFNTEFFYRVVGYFLGILIVLLTGATLCVPAKGLSFRVSLWAAVAGLVVTLAFQVMTVVQVLLGRRLIPRFKWLMGPLMWTLTHVDVFLFALMGVALLTAVVLFIRTKMTPVRGENPAERRKSKAEARRRVRLALFASAGLLFSLLVMTVGQSYANRGVELSPPMELPAEDGKIFISFETIGDGQLHRFVYKAGDGTAVRYIVIRKNESAWGVGLDACDVCGATGYYQRRDQVVCILCDVVMNISTIGLPGGCNPVPLRHAVEKEGLVIMTRDLEAEKRRFR
jgi:uncharacterized membrane protein